MSPPSQPRFIIVFLCLIAVGALSASSRDNQKRFKGPSQISHKQPEKNFAFCVSVVRKRAAKIGENTYVTDVSFEGDQRSPDAPTKVAITLNNAVVIERLILRNQGQGQFTLEFPGSTNEPLLEIAPDAEAKLKQEVVDQYTTLVLHHTPPFRDNLYPLDYVPSRPNLRVTLEATKGSYQLEFELNGVITFRRFVVMPTLNHAGFFIGHPLAKEKIGNRPFKYIHFIGTQFFTELKRQIEAFPNFPGTVHP